MVGGAHPTEVATWRSPLQTGRVMTGFYLQTGS